MRGKLRMLGMLAVLPLALTVTSCARGADAAPVMTVYQSPSCGCCGEWVEHMKQNGFEMKVVKQEDMAPVKAEHAVPRAMTSCHTGIVDGYVVEGHVPADVVKKMLAERPQVAGIAVPGMPAGSPGMEAQVQISGPEPYEVFTFDASGPLAVYAVR